MTTPAVPAMPTREYGSAAWTFSMSRLAMRLPMVGRRSAAMTTPPAQASAAIVGACGAECARGRAYRGGVRGDVRGQSWRQWPPPGQQLRRGDAQEVSEGRRADGG